MQLNFISSVLDVLEEYLFDHISSRNENTKRLTVSRKYIFDAYFTRINTSSIPSTFQQVSLGKLHVKNSILCPQFQFMVSIYIFTPLSAIPQHHIFCNVCSRCWYFFPLWNLKSHWNVSSKRLLGRAEPKATKWISLQYKKDLVRKIERIPDKGQE